MSAAYEGWALLELMGHRKRVGKVSEVEAFGSKLLRIDVLSHDGSDEGGTTEFYGAASIYALSPVTEEMARKGARLYGARPVRRPQYALEDYSGRDGSDPGE